MQDKFNNPLVNDIKKILTEDPKESAIIPAISGMVSLNYIDITNPDEPIVVFRGAGTLPYSNRFKFMKTELQRLADNVMTASNMLKILTDVDGRNRSGKLTAYYIKGFAEAEQLMEMPATKTKISKAKKAKASKIN
jgi:hypothetical protein